MESDRKRQRFVEKVLKKSPSSLEETSITAMATMEEASPSRLRTYRAQRDHPNRGSTRRTEPARAPLRIGKMRGRPMKASTFLVRAKGCEPKARGVPATRLLGCSPSGDQIPGRFPSLGPTTDEPNRSIRCACKPPLRYRDE